MIHRLLLLVGLVVLVSAPPAAAGVMYGAQELAAERGRIEARVRELHERVALFLPAEARALARVPIQVPDAAADGDPMGFRAYADRVVLPLEGLKFIEDLTMAYAWRFQAGRSLEPFDEYLAMIRWKARADWPGGRYLPPLEALGAPPRIWERDPAVGRLGTGFRNEAWAFILAHELAHVHLAHAGRTRDAATSRRFERDADRFALDLLERAGTVPMGAILYFQATAAFYASRADVPTDAAWDRWKRTEATHPTNPDRLAAIARHLRGRAGREADPRQAELLRFIGRKLDDFALILAQPAMQQLIVRRAVHGDPRDLAAR